jgi:hypothetical protein
MENARFAVEAAIEEFHWWFVGRREAPEEIESIRFLNSCSIELVG